MDSEKLKLMKKLAQQAEPLIREKHLVWHEGELVQVYKGEVIKTWSFK